MWCLLQGLRSLENESWSALIPPADSQANGLCDGDLIQQGLLNVSQYSCLPQVGNFLEGARLGVVESFKLLLSEGGLQVPSDQFILGPIGQLHGVGCVGREQEE